MTEPPTPDYADHLISLYVHCASLYSRCVSRLEQLGIPVVIDPDLHGVNGIIAGRCYPDHIEIRPDARPPYQFCTLLHELAHFYLHQPRQGLCRVPKLEEEFEANAVALSLFDNLGLTPLCPHSWHQHIHNNFEVIRGRDGDYFTKRIDMTVWLIWSFLSKEFDEFKAENGIST